MLSGSTISCRDFLLGLFAARDLRDGDVSGAAHNKVSGALYAAVWTLCASLSSRDSACPRLGCLLGALLLPGVLLASPAALHLFAKGFSAVLLDVYPLAWGAPRNGTSPFKVPLDQAAQVYARLSAHYLARPLPGGPCGFKLKPWL